MSDSAGRDDDVDDVTLWAGRLRAWPVPRPADAEGDETVPSRRAAPVEGGSDLAAVDDTVRSRIAARDIAREVTDPDITAVRDTVAATTEGETAAASPVAADAPAGHASPTGAPAEPLSVIPLVGASVTDADDTEQGDTAEGSRRRRGAPRDPAPPHQGAARRQAHAPAPLGRESYAPRVGAPVRVTRAVPEPVSSTADAAASTPRRPRDGSRIVVLAAVILAVAALAVVGVIVLVG